MNQNTPSNLLSQTEFDQLSAKMRAHIEARKAAGLPVDAPAQAQAPTPPSAAPIQPTAAPQTYHPMENVGYVQTSIANELAEIRRLLGALLVAISEEMQNR